ncbi:TipAS antibiotic-recognition domain-containing protein [Bacillus sp. JCM 19041]|uniref:TipAS antibiotic-recognition domain-containing protein n=1 Tax=Bacillus sp. JCM 19041 TaxID=1460637 RepID=UPI0006D29E71
MKYEKEVNWDVLFSIIHLFQGGKDGVVELLQPYLSNEEVNQIMDMKQAQDEESQEKWEALLTDVRADLNKDPGSEEVQALAARWWKYVKEMFGADEGLIERMWAAMSSEKDHIMFYPMDKQVIDFMDKAIAIMHEREAVINDN